MFNWISKGEWNVMGEREEGGVAVSSFGGIWVSKTVLLNGTAFVDSKLLARGRGYFFPCKCFFTPPPFLLFGFSSSSFEFLSFFLCV